MPRKKDEALHAARQQQILDAARTCFIANGFHQTSMRQILDEAGISSGGAYNYFSSKEDIVRALVEVERADIDLLLGQLSGAKAPLPAIAQLVFDSIAHYAREDAVLAIEIYAESCRNPAIDEVIRANDDRMREALRAAVTRGRKSGAITAQHSAGELTEWVLALIDGYIGRLAANPGLAPKKAARMAKQSVTELLGSGK